MFALPRSSWADYDASLISKGGGVFPRSQKSIPLSAEVRAMLGIDGDGDRAGRADRRDPEGRGRPALVRRHRHLHQGARARASRRSATRPTTRSGSMPPICASRRSARAPTSPSPRPARIEFSQHGGRINTDFIDNSAGVDCSDNEVNIKIPLNREMSEGRLELEERNLLLAEMTDEVAEHRARGQSAADAGAVDRRARRRAGAAAAGPRDRDPRGERQAQPRGRGAGQQRGTAPPRPAESAA